MSPHLDVVRVERVWLSRGVVRIAARTRELMVACPDCRCASARVHSRYSRTLADVAAGGRPVLISLMVRRLFCDSADCGRRTFAEQVEGLTVRYQRRSPLLQHLVEMAGVLLAGRGGARLLRILKTPLSRTSVLFQLMRMGLPSVATPRVLGVDDFALYADVYGTLLVDADTRLPIELWAGRYAEQLASWLRAHPGVEVVCRDGSLVYRQGITEGAPDAVQVSDRFHLWQGLSKRVSDIAAAHRDCLAAAVPEPEPAPPPSDELREAADTPARRHAKRLFETVQGYTGPARSLSAIARELGLNRRTVAKYARAGLQRPLPTGQDGHRAATPRSADRHTARAATIAPPGRPVDHHHTTPARPARHRGTPSAAGTLPGARPNPHSGKAVRGHAPCPRRRPAAGLARPTRGLWPACLGEPGQRHP